MAAVLSTGVVACSGTANRPLNALAGEREATIEVTNNNWADMVVYVERSGMATRLGMVRAMDTRTFTLRPPILGAGGDLYFLADPIGSNRVYRSPVALVTSGQRVEFKLENHLPLSSLSVW